MNFSSFDFIFLFLPVFLGGYFLLGRYAGRVWPTWWVILGSLFFYGSANQNFLWLLAISMGVNYFCYRCMGQPGAGRKWFYGAGILFNLLFLGYFKYCDFFIGSVNFLFKSDYALQGVMLPLGISFFTFQQISFLTEYYRDKLSERYGFRDYVFFITYFPKLSMGPIAMPDELLSQVRQPGHAHFQANHVAAGFFLFAVGLAKKSILAAFFAEWADAAFGAESLPIFDAWQGLLGYTFQLYFDFSGYCDMAAGLSLMMNIDLPLNFNSPYQSSSIQSFWRTWHITLGRFLTQYVYFPLGGSRGGDLKTCRNLVIIFLLSGLWHGAGWMFVLWGGAHGLASCVHRLWSRRHRPLPPALSIPLTFLFVISSWVLFRSSDLASAGRVYAALLDFSSIRQLDGEFWSHCSLNGLVLFLVSSLIIFAGKNPAAQIGNFRNTPLTAVITILLFVASVFSLNKVIPFIYVNF